MWNNTSNMLIKHMALLGTNTNCCPCLLIKRLLGFECNLNASESCNRLRLLHFLIRLHTVKQRLLAPVFFSSPFLLLLFLFLPPLPSPAALPLLKAITEIQFLIPPHRSSIDCKQIYIQAVNRKLQRFIY